MSIQRNISVIIPCYNEEKYIVPLIENILAQDYPQNKIEVIFADGQSEDKTKELIQCYSVKYPKILCIVNPDRYVPQALNSAIKRSTGEIIIRLDAHAIYPTNYFSVLVDKLVSSGADNVGGIWITQPGAPTIEAKAIVLATSHPVGIGNASYRLGTENDTEVDTVPFGCFHRELFNRIGFFDVDLSRNQDDEFNGRIKKNGGKIILIPSLKIQYFARPDLTKLKRMFYQYGLFKPLVNLKLGTPATLRQFAPPGLVLSIFILMVLSFYQSIFGWILCAEMFIYGIMILLTSFFLARRSGLKLFVYTFITFLVIHFSYGIGYIFGIVHFTLFKTHLKGNHVVIKSNR